MNRAPFFLCEPRSRSSILFETAQYWAQQRYGLLPLEGHTELFLEVSRNALFVDAKTDEKFECELYPIANGAELNIHYIYPHVLKTSSARNLHKIEMLRKLRSQGKNYNIKGTMNLVHTIDPMLDFFSDRKFIITRRRDLTAWGVSLMYAFNSKLFHARDNNLEKYQQLLEQGIEISEQTMSLLPRYYNMIRKLRTIEPEGCEIVYYEDIDTREKIYDCIDNIYCTKEWRDTVPLHIDNLTPIKLDKDYSTAIKNYDQLLDKISQCLK